MDKNFLDTILPRIPEDKMSEFITSVSAHAEKEAQRMALEDPIANRKSSNYLTYETANNAISAVSEAVLELLACRFDREAWLKQIESTISEPEIRCHILNVVAPIENALRHESTTVYGTLTWAKAIGKELEAEQLIKAGFSSPEAFLSITK